MRNKVCKRLRKEAGTQTSTSNVLEYEYLKKEHKKPIAVEPNTKRSKRQMRLNKVLVTKSTTRSGYRSLKNKVRRKLKG